MNICSVTRGNPISYCATGPYGQNPIYVGEVAATVDDAYVVFENLATGRTTFHANTGTLPLLEIEQPSGLSPGQIYRVSVEYEGEEISFTPYTYVPASNTYAIGTTSVTAVHVNARKTTDESGDIVSPSEQWIAI